MTRSAAFKQTAYVIRGISPGSMNTSETAGAPTVKLLKTRLHRRSDLGETIGVSQSPPPMSRLDPALLAARWTCGDLLPENVPGIAVELIEAGQENSAVYRVAAEDRVYSRDQIEILVQRLFVALGVSYPMSLEGARQTVAWQIAREVAAGLRDPWTAAAQLDRVVPHWEAKDENVLAIYLIADEAEWDPGYGRGPSTLQSELIEAFGRLARSESTG